MVVVSRLISIVLRSLELLSAVIVAGIIGHELDIADDNDYFPPKRYIYTEVVAGIAILFSLLMLIPFTWAINAFAFDFVMFILWIIAFGLLSDYIAPLNCSYGWAVGPGNYWANDYCSRLKSALAFSFISAMLWLASAVLALWVIWRTSPRNDAPVRRRRWFGRSYV